MKFLQTAPGDEPVKVSGLFNAPASRLFKAWTDPEEVKMWFGPHPNSLINASINLQVGESWCFVLDDSKEKHEQVEGKYLDIEENSKLVFSWRHVKQFADGRSDATDYSKVTVQFISKGEATQLELCHEAIVQEDGRRGVGRGWQACFEHLAQIVVNEIAY